MTSPAAARHRARRRALLPVGALVLAAMALPATPAHAYVRYLSKMGKPYFWVNSCARVQVFPMGIVDMTPDEVAHAASEAARQWTVGNPDLASCTYLDLPVTVEAASAVRPTAKYDNKNNIIFRSDAWCPENDPADMCYEPAALALTSIWAKDASGQIVDADVQVNVVNFAWADLDVTVDPRRQDLQNALTHEMGHFIGLDHTCYQPGTVSSPPLDNNGNPIPTCDSASDEVRATTMFASAPPGDKEKRTLEADDRQAVCDIYPIARDPATCPALDNGQTGCACAVGEATSAGWRERLAPGALAMVFAGLWLARARRSRRQRTRAGTAD